MARRHTAALAAKGDVFNGGQTGAVTVGTNDATALTLKTNNAAAVTVDAAGNVGIGTTAPAAALDVESAMRGMQLGYYASDLYASYLGLKKARGTVKANRGRVEW